MSRQPVSDGELRLRALELSRQAPLERARQLEEGLLILRLGGEAYGIRASRVQEVVCRPAITPLPLQARCVAGVMNLRGEVVAVLDLAAMLQLPVSETRPFAVVARHEDMTAAFLADDVTDVEWFAADSKEPVLPTVPSEVSCFFDGVFHSEERLVSAIDLGKLLEHPELLKLRKASEGPP